MLVEQIDINRIKELLESVPSKMEITSIDLTNGYSLNLVAGEKEIRNVNYENALNRLNNILEAYKKFDEKQFNRELGNFLCNS